MGGVYAVLWLIGIFLAVSVGMCVLVGGGRMVGRVLMFMLLKDLFVGGGTSSAYASSEEVMASLTR